MPATQPTWPISKATAPAFDWRDGYKGWNLVSLAELHIVQEWMPPHAHEVAHIHESTHQFYFVLAGEAHVVLNGHHYILRAHEGIEIPLGAVHQMKTDELEVEFLVISSGPPRDDRVDVGLDTSV
jgi:mannose-6-phosphate isomerase-like protein (cupin superfamily)